MRFVKMHGLSNDYVFVDADREKVNDPSATALAVSPRHTGIGGDGLVLFGRESGGADFWMRIFNADGSEAEMCGNAARCIGKYLYERGYTRETQIALKTLAGIKRLHVFPDEEGLVGSVSVDMGEPGFAATDLGMTVGIPEDRRVMIALKDASYEATPVSMGNPHAVLFVQDVAAADVWGIGAAIEHHPAFANRTNVEFVQVLSPQHIRVRVWERGSGETQACGTGACAAQVAAHLRGYTGRAAVVSLPGGDLRVEWGGDGTVIQQGPASIVFEGEYLEPIRK